MEKAVGSRELVERVVRDHAGWVLAAAKRRVSDATLAEDVAQAVFLLYWRKGVGIAHEGKRVGWLYRAVRYCSANALRLRNTREQHEREAAMERQRDGRSAGWSEVEARLEGAVDLLSEQDRRAVVLRFYRNLSLREVGEAMGLSEEAARKRVDRAIGKLRERLVAAGIEVEARSLAGIILTHAGAEASARLMERLVGGTEAGMGSSTARAIAEGAVKTMALAKVKMVAVGLTLVAVTGAFALTLNGAAATSSTPTVVTNPSPSTSGPSAAPTPSSGSASPPAAALTDRAGRVVVQIKLITVSRQKIPGELLDPTTKELRSQSLDPKQVEKLEQVARSVVSSPEVTVDDGGKAQANAVNETEYTGLQEIKRPDGTKAYTTKPETAWDGVKLGVAARVSKDRRYARLKLDFEFQKLFRIATVDFKPEGKDQQPIRVQDPVVQAFSTSSDVAIPDGQYACLGSQTIPAEAEGKEDSVMLAVARAAIAIEERNANVKAGNRSSASTPKPTWGPVTEPSEER